MDRKKRMRPPHDVFIVSLIFVVVLTIITKLKLMARDDMSSSPAIIFTAPPALRAATQISIS
jgi:hypothetical protein